MHKNKFPIFENNRELVYLDSAATTQKPKEVLDAMYNYNIYNNASPNRGSYKLSLEATNLYKESKKNVATFIGAESEEIIYTKSATESLNLISYVLEKELKKNDEILVGISSHHSNLVPWQELAKRKNIVLKYIYLDKNGEFDLSDLKNKLSNNTRLVTFSYAVNTTGVVHDVKKIINLIKTFNTNIKIIVDGAQIVLHKNIDVKKLDIDFFVFSAHKMFGPIGIGVLYIKKELIEKLPPFLYGGDMIEFVEETKSIYKNNYEKYEGGTQSVELAVGLSAAIEFINKIGIKKIETYEKELHDYLLSKLKELDFIEIYFENQKNKTPVIAFNVKNVHSHDVSQILDMNNIAIRTGHHCTQPLMKYLNIPSCCRVSLSIYNTENDINKLIKSLYKVKEIFY
ncbi:cysteine desulfurase/selenocysteine lyase [Hypnocyclicus thermotrophus]|uniref:Cysteine desulfurase n=1 Tax=Hypnocyclicus thermotrophus TaxID=1627895 RepID=A0AA46I5Z1_9FUSO|nr:SufS family cysteine desulfurase [Hypnocyclicus thermotrophus]TDT69882.1 cysteine desulfurase/selenocysteine lyase [Hypnocyclicus thermotrophus]